MVKNITIAEALKLNNALLVDVRSENEYAADTIPGAVNIPALNNEERAAVGLTYHQKGTESAIQLGLQLVSPKLVEKISSLDKMACNRKIVVFCWRGGQRSALMSALFNSAGFSVYCIAGGYKAYRRHVNEYLVQSQLPLNAIVLHGLTGVGKTDLLLRLAQEEMPVLDLEGLARHRGSVYGKIGLFPSPSQKFFESQITHVLKKACERGFVLVECESRRVGNLIVPPPVMTLIRQGTGILLYSSMENRVQRIKEVYAGRLEQDTVALQKATSALVKKLGRNQVETLNALLAEKKVEPVICFMLKYHYDPLYNYPDSPSAEYDLCVNIDDLEQALQTVRHFITNWTSAHLEIPVFDTHDPDSFP